VQAMQFQDTHLLKLLVLRVSHLPHVKARTHRGWIEPSAAPPAPVTSAPPLLTSGFRSELAEGLCELLNAREAKVPRPQAVGCQKGSGRTALPFAGALVEGADAA
jgi:hypothetical protein